jgi:enoyl-CoA hydratase/carnithine racemase
MKKYENIIVQMEGQIGCLTLNRQSKNNALDIKTSKEIYEGLKELELNQAIKVILIQGNQKNFSPGADINELKHLDSDSAEAKKLFNFFDRIKEIKIPIIAAVEGFALGGGMELALICDVIIASKEARFAQPEINLGLMPGIGGTQRLKHYLGKHNANYICLTGEIITGQRAYELGLASVLLEKNNFLEEAKKIVKKIAEKPKLSLIEIKKLISNNILLERGLEEERKSFYSLLSHKNAKIGISAFLKKIKADWKD